MKKKRKKKEKKSAWAIVDRGTFRVPFSKHINFKCPCHVIVNVVFLVFLTTFVR